MLEKIANRFQTAVLVFLVSLISVVFVLQFGGPQAEGCTSAEAVYVAKVYGQPITEGDLRAHRLLSGFDRFPEEVVKQLGLESLVLEGMVERAILAREARSLGLRLTEDEVMTRIADSGNARVSLGAGAPFGLSGGERPVPVKDTDGNFDKDGTKRFIQYGLRRTISEFLDGQVEEVLAEDMRNLLKATVEVAPEEVWESYKRDQNRRSVSYVRFPEAYYSEQVKVTPAAVAAWSTTNKKQVDDEFKRLAKEDASTKRDDVAERLFREAQGKKRAKTAAYAFLAKAKAVKSPEEWSTLSEELEKQAATETKVAEEKSAADTESAGEEAPSADDSTNPLAPMVKTAVSFRPIDSPIAGLSNAKAFVRASFAMSNDNEVYERPLKLGDEYVVMRLDSIETKTREDFEKESTDFEERMLQESRKKALRYFTYSLRKDAEDHIEYPKAGG